MEFWLIGAAIVISAIVITRNMSNEKTKGDMMVSIMVGMWVVVLLVLAVAR